MPDTRQKLIGLPDYVEQVVRLDERVAFRLSEYRLPDGSIFAVGKSDTQNLLGVRHDHRDEVDSRSLDRVVRGGIAETANDSALVRSVRREELNPNDLRARLIAHFEYPMPELEGLNDALAVCESDFERDLMKRLLERGYRVQGQVGSTGYRIDMVVEGADGRMRRRPFPRPPTMAARYAAAARSRTSRLAFLALLCLQLLPGLRTGVE
jgi:hypothetical protein